MKFPFSACIGQDIENLVYTDNAKEAALFFQDAIKNLKNQDKLILCIPQDIINCVAKNEYIKVFLQLLNSNTQAKVTIERRTVSHCDWETNAEKGFSTTDFMLGQIQKRELPFTIGLNNTNIVKYSCVSCATGRPCSAAMTFYGKQLVTTFIEDIKATNSSFIKEIAEQALDVFYHDFILDQDNRILLARLLFIREGLDCLSLKHYDSVYLSKDFFDDVNKATVDDRCLIVLSAARSFCFPPVDNVAKREKGSLDWHKDKQPLKGVEFFRADVLSGLQTGRQKSGAKRLLFGRRRSDSKIILFGYTPDHDFDPIKLKKRWNDAEKELETVVEK
jgi:hypothetical protein